MTHFVNITFRGEPLALSIVLELVYFIAAGKPAQFAVDRKTNQLFLNDLQVRTKRCRVNTHAHTCTGESASLFCSKHESGAGVGLEHTLFRLPPRGASFAQVALHAPHGTERLLERECHAKVASNKRSSWRTVALAEPTIMDLQGWIAL